MSMLKTINGVGSLLMSEAMALPSGLTREVHEKLDDAMDLICSTLVANKFGVEVVCNPEGNRNLILIDGVAMNRFEFADWLLAKETEPEANEQMQDQVNPETGEVTVNEYSAGQVIEIISFDGELTDRMARREVKYATGYFVAADSEHTIEYDAENDLTMMHNVKLGRKASAAELAR